jgi:hypothetical protein
MTTGQRQRAVIFFARLSTVFVLAVLSMHIIATWYAASIASRPMVLGVSFIPAYAESLGLDPRTTMQALIDDAGVRHFRLVSYWNELEPSPGKYDFTRLDWQFKKAEQAHAKITLSLGLRQPRWPECHIPQWAQDMKSSSPDTGSTLPAWQPNLENFMTKVVERYKKSPALDSYQVENEFFLKGFGLCTNFDRNRLVSEYNLVKRIDPDHKLIIARSNNAVGWPAGAPKPDEYGISIYKRVWSSNTGIYIEYPYPSWYYSFLGGWEKLMTGRDLMAHELQAEAWPPRQQNITDISIAEQDKSFSPQIFKNRLKFAHGTGLREIYLWGGEYWYYRKVKLHDPSLWDVAKAEFAVTDD